jgi:Family of unknown function (DUF5675)
MGELWLDGKFECYTLEPPRHDPPAKPRCIPTGRYEFIIAFSPRHNRNLPLLENVPDFEGIEIHTGNYPKDTEGCILVGEVMGEGAIYQSTVAFNKLFPKLTPGDIWVME